MLLQGLVCFKPDDRSFNVFILWLKHADVACSCSGRAASWVAPSHAMFVLYCTQCAACSVCCLGWLSCWCFHSLITKYS